MRLACHNCSFFLSKIICTQKHFFLLFHCTCTICDIKCFKLIFICDITQTHPICISRCDRMSHLCRHAMNARLRSGLRRHLFSTLHDDPKLQLPYHRSHNEHWLQSLHSKKCRTTELFSTAFQIRRCYSYRSFQLCWMNELKRRRRSYVQKTAINPSPKFLDWNFLADWILDINWQYHGMFDLFILFKISFWNPHVPLHHRK